MIETNSAHHNGTNYKPIIWGNCWERFLTGRAKQCSFKSESWLTIRLGKWWFIAKWTCQDVHDRNSFWQFLRHQDQLIHKKYKNIFLISCRRWLICLPKKFLLPEAFGVLYVISFNPWIIRVRYSVFMSANTQHVCVALTQQNQKLDHIWRHINHQCPYKQIPCHYVLNFPLTFGLQTNQPCFFSPKTTAKTTSGTSRFSAC